MSPPVQWDSMIAEKLVSCCDPSLFWHLGATKIRATRMLSFTHLQIRNLLLTIRCNWGSHRLTTASQGWARVFYTLMCNAPWPKGMNIGESKSNPGLFVLRLYVLRRVRCCEEPGCVMEVVLIKMFENRYWTGCCELESIILVQGMWWMWWDERYGESDCTQKVWHMIVVLRKQTGLRTS